MLRNKALFLSLIDPDSWANKLVGSYEYMCYDPRAHRVCEVHGSVPNLTQELKWKNGFIEAHGLTEEPTERPKSS